MHKGIHGNAAAPVSDHHIPDDSLNMPLFQFPDQGQIVQPPGRPVILYVHPQTLHDVQRAGEILSCFPRPLKHGAFMRERVAGNAVSFVFHSLNQLRVILRKICNRKKCRVNLFFRQQIQEFPRIIGVRAVVKGQIQDFLRML